MQQGEHAVQHQRLPIVPGTKDESVEDRRGRGPGEGSGEGFCMRKGEWRRIKCLFSGGGVERLLVWEGDGVGEAEMIDGEEKK